MKFIDTQRFSPVIYEKDLPHARDLFHIQPRRIPEAEKQFEVFLKDEKIIADEEWWEIQRYRCINGYTVPNAVVPGGDCFVDDVDVLWLDKDTRYIPRLDLLIKNNTVHISGRMYFYLNFWKIKRVDELTETKRIMNPRFTDLSWENWMIREMMYKKRKDNLWAKCRQRGLSEEEAANLAYDFLFIPESQGVVVAGEEKYSLNTFKFIKRGLRHLLNTQYYKTLERNTDEWIFSKYTGSEIYCRTAKDNPEALSSLSPSKVLFEEIGVWKKGLVKECAEFVKASLSAEGIKTGYCQYTGTGGNVENSVADMEEMTYNPANFDLLEFDNIYSKDSTSDRKIACFVPAWKFAIIDKDGNSLRKEGTEFIENYRNSGKPKERYTRITQRPLYIEEIFNVASGGYFGPEITQLLNDRYYHINTHSASQIERPGYLKWKNKSKPFEGVDFVDDPNGNLIIIEEPQQSEDGSNYPNLYMAGTDSYDQDEAHYSESKGSIVIKKRFLNMKSTYDLYVAHLIERPLTSEGGSERFYEDCAKLCIYYGCAINNIEWSNPRIFDWFTNNGFESLLMTRPMMATANVIKQSFLQNRYGTDKSLKPHFLAMLRDNLTEDFISRMFIKRQIMFLSKFQYDPSGKKYNCDTTIATGLVELACKEYQFITVQDAKKIETKKGVRVYKTINGQLTSVFI